MKNRNLGILLIILGAAFILNYYFGVFSEFSTWWPSLIILLGVYQLVKRTASPAAGLVTVFIGAALQARMLDLLPGALLFPLILILIGCGVIFHRSRRRDAQLSEDYIDYFVIFSGLENRNHTQNFKGGSVTALFGGAEIDLRDAALSSEGGLLEVTAAFGGIDLRVPEEWKVVVTGTPLFGGWENKTTSRKNPAAEGPVLKIHCLALFGGVEIKN